MKVRKAIKKMVALGSGLTMVGATLFGAAAADLSEYPSPLFIKDGRFDGIIVVGDDAAASDVIGSIDIATALQAEAVVEEAYAPGTGLYQGGTAPGVSFSGDVTEIGQPNDLLELREEIGDVRPILTANDLNALRGGVITTDEGTTDYNQYLRFREGSKDINFTSTFVVTYDKDEDDNVGDFLFANDTSDRYMFEIHLQFEEGAESEIKSTNELPDLEDEIFSILGTPFAVADTDISTAAHDMTLTLMGGAIADIMEEGETKEYVIDGVPYEVNVLIVSDNTQVVKFKINGEITDAMRDGEADVLKDGTRVGVREILANEAEEVTGGDLVEFYLGATEIKLTDGFGAVNFTNGSIEVNDELIEDAAIDLRGREFSSDSKFELLDFKYRLEADSLVGDLFIPPGHGLREYMAEPEGMMSPNWDIVYGGLMDVGTSILKFDSAGDDEYDVAFTNQEGLNYRFQLLDNSDTEGFRIGEKKHDLIWVEMDNSVDFRIAKDDVFILTDDNDETGYTHIVKYENYESDSRQLTFTDLYGETREFTTQDVPNVDGKKAEIIFGGNSFIIYVNNTDPYNISVDFNNDGIFGDGTVGGTGSQTPEGMNNECQTTDKSNWIGLSINVTGGVNHIAKGVPVSSTTRMGPCRSAIVIQGGGILDLGVCDSKRPFGNALCNATTVVGATQWREFNASGTDDTCGFGLALKTLNSEFDEDGPEDTGGDEIISFKIVNQSSHEVCIRINTGINQSRLPIALNELKENDDIERAMTSYGVLLEYYNPSGEAEDLTFEYPLVQRGAHVFVVAGEYSLEKKTGGVAQRIQKIKVGAAKLASEVADITAYNAIVVGGPCANSAAAALLGNPADCTAGFEPGKAIIKLFENRGKVAVLVAGYDALDTRRAARVLANHQDYVLKGKEAVITGTSLTDIRVASVG